MSQRGWSRVLAVAVLVGGLAVVQAVSTPAGAEDWAFEKTVTATRQHIDEDGTIDEDSRTSEKVDVRVSDVKNLRGRQELAVEWSGAHPTGGLVTDPTSSEAKDQEYPVVVLQCRGIDTTGKVASGQTRLSPESCWTQSAPERYFASSSQVPVWRADAYAAEKDRAPVVGAPDPLPKACDDISKPVTARWLPIKAADRTVYHGGPDPSVGCSGSAPESSDVSDGALPSNTVYGVTDKDGNGRASFPVWTASENATLGCTASVKCALVVVPIVGLSCDAWGTKLAEPQTQANGNPLTPTNKATANTSCRRSGVYAPGETRDSTQTADQAVRGAYWWSESNWRNRVTVPLSFAPTGGACAATGGQDPLEIGGSVVLNELTASWRPTFCTSSSLFPFLHVQQADFYALGQVENGTLAGAFASNAPEEKFTKPIVPAPVTVGGFAIAFSIDDTSRNRQQDLNLNARLVAKLITQSYPVAGFIRSGRNDLGDNPLNMSQDPEFQALNPGLIKDGDIESAGALQLLSTRADLVSALTAWIDADPEARAWIDGKPDPWGMKVNQNYRGEELSDLEENFLRDTTLAPDSFQNANRCYARSPTPYLNLVSNPQNSLDDITRNLQYSSSAVLTACNFTTDDPVTSLALKKIGRESIGKRFVLGLVSLSAADRYNLRTAALQTTTTVSAGQTFTGPAGRTFVKASTASLRRAAASLKADPDTKVWSFDYAALQKAAGKDAYPGILPTFLAVPTTGLSATESTDLAKFLCYAVDDKRGVKQGDANGELPVGYLALSEKNGLAAQRDYTLNAVSAIRNQTKSVPAVDAKKLSYDAVCDFGKKATPVATSTPSGGSAGGVGGAVDVPVSDVPTDDAAKSADPDGTSQTADLALTAGEHSALGNIGAPLLLLLALLAGLGGSALRWSEPLAAAFREARSRVDLGGRHRKP